MLLLLLVEYLDGFILILVGWPVFNYNFIILFTFCLFITDIEPVFK
jgi:hypothetical protein